jgi:hypothetical protein
MSIPSPARLRQRPRSRGTRRSAAFVTRSRQPALIGGRRGIAAGATVAVASAGLLLGGARGAAVHAGDDGGGAGAWAHASRVDKGLPELGEL